MPGVSAWIRTGCVLYAEFGEGIARAAGELANVGRVVDLSERHFSSQRRHSYRGRSGPQRWTIGTGPQRRTSASFSRSSSSATSAAVLNAEHTREIYAQRSYGSKLPPTEEEAGPERRQSDGIASSSKAQEATTAARNFLDEDRVNWLLEELGVLRFDFAGRAVARVLRDRAEDLKRNMTARGRGNNYGPSGLGCCSGGAGLSCKTGCSPPPCAAPAAHGLSTARHDARRAAHDMGPGGVSAEVVAAGRVRQSSARLSGVALRDSSHDRDRPSHETQAHVAHQLELEPMYFDRADTADEADHACHELSRVEKAAIFKVGSRVAFHFLLRVDRAVNAACRTGILLGFISLVSLLAAHLLSYHRRKAEYDAGELETNPMTPLFAIQIGLPSVILPYILFFVSSPGDSWERARERATSPDVVWALADLFGADSKDCDAFVVAMSNARLGLGFSNVVLTGPKVFGLIGYCGISAALTLM
jgi:hypothetical protein